MEIDNKLYGTGFFGLPMLPKKSILGKKFFIPPFSVIDSKQGFWIDRRRRWKKLGLKGEMVRKDIGNGVFNHLKRDCEKGIMQSEKGRIAKGKNSFNDLALNPRMAESTKLIAKGGDTPSIFDPVLVETLLNWFSANGDMILDPFAGGSVRGIVSVMLDRHYFGNDLSAGQILENRAQANKILGHITKNNNMPIWTIGDSESMICDAPMSDLILSCPPYGNLEIYSNDKNDISNMPYEDFLKKYFRIIKNTCDRLKNNRFACFVVSNFRNQKTGEYINLTGDTIIGFQKSGLIFYNDVIFLNSINTGSIRASFIFPKQRKLIKLHQNILIFLKGDPKKASERLTKNDEGEE